MAWWRPPGTRSRRLWAGTVGQGERWKSGGTGNALERWKDCPAFPPSRPVPCASLDPPAAVPKPKAAVLLPSLPLLPLTFKGGTGRNGKKRPATVGAERTPSPGTVGVRRGNAPLGSGCRDSAPPRPAPLEKGTATRPPPPIWAGTSHPEKAIPEWPVGSQRRWARRTRPEATP